MSTRLVITLEDKFIKFSLGISEKLAKNGRFLRQDKIYVAYAER